MSTEFVAPSWLNDQDAETIHKRMMEALPPDIDNTEAGFPWDMTKPTALEKAELLQFHLTETLKLMFPMWAYDHWLDYHAQRVHLTRRPGTSAYGTVTITGLEGTIIPQGFIFAVPAVGNSPAVEFYTAEEVTIDSSSTVEVGVIAAEIGLAGNVPAGAITIMAEPMTGITSITNQEQITGGTVEEDDESLRERILEAEQAAEAGYIGCDADYIRWAKEVPGVGEAFVIPQWDQDVKNSVKVIVLDANGEPANELILEAVNENIISPDDRSKRKAPIGAIVTVVAPDMVSISYALNAVLNDGYSAEDVRSDIAVRIEAYYAAVKEENLLKYNEIHAIITNTPGIYDFTGLTINGKTENIVLAADEYPNTGSIDLVLTEGADIS